MTERAPLKEAIDAAVDEARIHRVWSRVRTRDRSRTAPLRWTLGLGTLAAVVMGVFVLTRQPPAPFLAMADGGAPTAVTAPEATTLRFADASTITLDPEASLLPRTNDATRFGLELERGRAHFSVTPGGPRRWSIDCGLAEVEVVGTVFTIERDDRHVHVAVMRGRVHVRTHDGQLRVLSAGEQTDVAAPVVAASPSPSIAPVEPIAEPIVAIAPPLDIAPATPRAPARSVARETEVAAATPRWRTLASEGDYSGAYAALASGIDAQRSPADLLGVADVARLSGHPSEAIAPLTEILDQHPDAREAPLAAIQLGRIEDSSLHDPAEAAAAFRRAIALGVPRGLDDDVRGRLARTLHAAGDPAADGAASDYLARYPSGTHAAEVRGWSGQSDPPR